MEKVALTGKAYAAINQEKGRENAGFVVTEKGVVVIDTTKLLTNAASLYHHIRATTDKPVAFVVTTHFHADHVFGNQVFDAPIVAQRHDYERMKAMLQRDWNAEGLAKQVKDTPSPDTLEGVRIVLPQIVFDQGLTLEMGDTALQITHLGGHTSGSSIVYLPDEQALYAADLLFVGRYPAVISANVAQWIKALDHIQGMKVKVIVPGHGPVSTMEQIQTLRSYLQALRGTVADLAKQGMSAEQITGDKRLPSYMGLSDPAWHQAAIPVVYREVTAATG